MWTVKPKEDATRKEKAKWAADGPVHVSCAFLRCTHALMPDVLPFHAPAPATDSDRADRVLDSDDRGGIHSLIGRRDRLAETVRSMEERLMRKGYLISAKKSSHNVRGKKDPGEETDESLQEWLNDEGMDAMSEEDDASAAGGGKDDKDEEEEGKTCDVTAFKICAPSVAWPGLACQDETWEDHMGKLFNEEEGLKAIGIPPPREHLVSFLTECFAKDDLSNVGVIRAKLPELLRHDAGEWRWEDAQRTELPLPWIDEAEDVHWANFVLVCRPQNSRLFQQHWLHAAEKTQRPAIIEAKRQTFEKLTELKKNPETSKAIYISGDGWNPHPWIPPLRALKGLFCLEQRLDYAMENGFLPRWQTPKFRTKRERKDFCMDICRKLQGGNPEMVSYLMDDDGTGLPKPMIPPAGSNAPASPAAVTDAAPRADGSPDASARTPGVLRHPMGLDTPLHNADMLAEEKKPNGDESAVRNTPAALLVPNATGVPSPPAAVVSAAVTSGTGEGTDSPTGGTQHSAQRPSQHVERYIPPHRENHPLHPSHPSSRHAPSTAAQGDDPRRQQPPQYPLPQHLSQPARHAHVAALPLRELKHDGHRSNRVASRPFDHPDGRPRAGDIVSTKDNDINVKVVRVYVDIRTDSFGQQSIAPGGPYDIEMCDGGTLRLPLRKLQGALKWSVDEFCMVYNDDNWAHALVHEVPSSDKHAPYSLILESGRRVHKPLLYLRTYQSDRPPFDRDVARALSRAFDAFVIKETRGSSSVSAAKMEELCMRWEALPEDVKRIHLPTAMPRCRPTLCAGQDVTVVDGRNEERGTVVSVKATTAIVATQDGREREVPRENVIVNKMVRQA